MNVKKTPLFACALLAAALAVACAPNPADDKTEAVVQEPAETTAQAPSMEAVTYAIDPANSKITWVGSKVTGKHDGGFNAFSGEVTAAGTPESVAIKVTIDADSLYTDTDNLTKHLKSSDFFDVETFPTATFESTGVAAGDADGSYSVTGNLTLHGVTKQVTFPATISVTPDEVSAQAEFFIKRFDFELQYPGKPDDLIRDEVVIKLDINAMAQGSDGMGMDMGDTMVDETAGDTDDSDHAAHQ